MRQKFQNNVRAEISFFDQKLFSSVSRKPYGVYNIICSEYKQSICVLSHLYICNLAIAEVLGVKVCVSKEKKSILNCLESASISDMITTDYSSSCLHVLPMGKINHRDLSTYLNKWDGKYSKLIAFKPTGWTHSGKASFSLSDIKPAESCGVSVYGIPYSEHSSYVELKQAVQGWRPSKIIPTVNNGSPHKRAEMQRTFSSWLEQPIFTTRPSLLQSKLV